MTTEAAAQRYLSEHLHEWAGKDYAIHNPHDKPIEELPAIWGFNNGGSDGWLYAQLIAQDGTALGSHICSNEAYMPHDLGIVSGARPDRHETFRLHYPDGYRMDFVSGSEVLSHEGIKEAIRLNQEMALKDK